ncbi:MAG: photosynthetic reaction center subunit H [Pseudomonadota bacterium]
MIFGGEFVNGIDLADISLWLFTLFFFGLIFYLRREDRREGYPLERDTDGKLEDEGVFWYAPKKTFTLPHNRGTVSVPHGKRDERNHAMARTAVWPGAPYQPNGDPMKASVGPGSFAEREDVEDLTDDGRQRIAPLRVDGRIYVAKDSPNPVGMTVYGGDGKPAGTIVDVWVDRSEAIIRYLEVDVGMDGVSTRVLLPVPFAKINGRRKRVDVDAIFAEHFVDAPKTASPDSITRLEEDKVSAYYGGGKLYAHHTRTESFI